jgi:hypothetical protein
LALNNLMAALRVKQMQNDNWKPKKADFTDYVDNAKDQERAKAIRAMMLGSTVKWGAFSSKDFAKVGAKQTKALFLAYERAQHVWKAVEKISEVKALWQELGTILESQGVVAWVEKANWTLDDQMELRLEKDETLDYLAPLQRNMALQEGGKTEKQMVDKMNRIMMDTMAIAGMTLEGKEVLPEEVMEPFKQLMLVSGSFFDICRFHGTCVLAATGGMCPKQDQQLQVQEGPQAARLSDHQTDSNSAHRKRAQARYHGSRGDLQNGVEANDYASER